MRKPSNGTVLDQGHKLLSMCSMPMRLKYQLNTDKARSDMAAVR